MKKQVIICHAYNTLPTENWYKWLENVLVKHGYDAKIVKFPNPQAPSENEWVKSIKAAHTGNPVIFVGHSLGCRAILAYLNQYNVSAEKVILVACPMFWEGIIETRPALKAYVDSMQMLDFGKLKKLVGHFDIFHDTTDHLLPMKNAKYFKKVFGKKATLHISSSHDHFDIPNVPEIAALLL